MRIIAFALATLAAYILHTRSHAAAARLTRTAVVLLALSLLFALWAAHTVFDWTKFWHRHVFDWLPLDACVVGAVVGYILADQQISGGPKQNDERLRLWQRGEGTSVAGLGADRVLSWAGRLSDAAKTLATNAALAALVLAVVVPAQAWTEAIGRVQEVKAGSVALSLAANRQTELADTIRGAAQPRVRAETVPEDGLPQRTGFIPVRLETMQALTLPPRLAGVAGQPSPFRRPEAYIFSRWQTGGFAVGHSHRTRHVQRDRAIFWQLVGSAASREQELNRGVIGSPAANAAQASLESLGSVQEEFLSLLAPHVACLAGFVQRTDNRRLVEYQNFGIVEHLYIAAQLWSSLEKEMALGQGDGEPLISGEQMDRNTGSETLLGAPAPASRDVLRRSNVQAAAGQLSNRLGQLADALDRFAEWSSEFIRSWVSASAPGAALDPGEADEPNRVIPPCTPSRQAGEAIRVFAAEHLNRDAIGGLRRGWFSPYLAVFAGQALSAIGDHASAVRLLINWLSDLVEVETSAREWGHPQYQMAARWYRMQVFVELLVLQKLSEGSELGIPVRTEGLRRLVRQFFPDVVTALREPDTIPAWRRDAVAEALAALGEPITTVPARRQEPTTECLKPENRWKQPIIWSYVTWVKEYLDVSNRRAVRAEDLDAGDGALADLLADVDVNCFTDVLHSPDPARTHLLRVQNRAQLVATSTAIRLRVLTDDVGGLTADQKQRLRQRAETALRSALANLERASSGVPGLAGTEAERQSLRRLVYGQESADLIEATRDLKKRIDAVRRPTHN